MISDDRFGVLLEQALLEKEQHKAYVHQLARALRREQEKQAAAARHQVEQLRVEYLAREEKFVLDGDRRELMTIKKELDTLRAMAVRRAMPRCSICRVRVNDLIQCRW